MREKVKNFKELKVWKKAYNLTLEIYKVTLDFPKHEQFGLVSQLRRASVSIVSNIAEGYARPGRAEYLRFLSMGYASLAELETQALLACDLGYMTRDQLAVLLTMKDEIGAMLYSLQQKLKN